MKKNLILKLTFIIWTSCKENYKTDGKDVMNIRTEVESDYEKIETNNWLDLKYKVINEEGEDVRFASITNLPQFPGGYDSLANFIRKTVEYPKSAVEDSIVGSVRTTFIVDANGIVRDVNVVQGVRMDLDSACYKGISLIPDWKPAESRDGKKLMVQFLLPIKFMFEMKNKN